MAIGKKSVTSAVTTSATVSVVTSESPSPTAVGDLVLVIYGNNFYALSNMGTPSATGAPTMNAIAGAVADAGANAAHIKGFWYVANTAGAQTIQVTETGDADEEKYLIAYVLSGADTTTPVDGAAGSFGATSTSHVAPAVSPASSDAYVIAEASTGGGSSVASYTTPAPLTEDGEIHVGGISAVYASAQLAASGSTGTFTFTASGGAAWGAVTVAIKTSGGAAAAPDVVHAHWRLTPPGRISPAGRRNPWQGSSGASTGTAYDQPVDDTTDLTDSVAFELADVASDTEGLSDSTVLDRAAVTADATGLGDAAALDRAQVVDDSAGLTDSATVSFVKAQAATDDAGMTDTTSLARGVGVTQTDTEALTDALAVDRGQSATDSTGMTDSTTVARDIVSTATDTAGLTDSVTVDSGTGVISQTDAEALTDAIVLARDQRPTDTAGLTDSAALSLSRAVTDTAALTDSTTVENGKIVAATDTAAMTDAVVLQLFKTITDDPGLADLAALARGLVATDSGGLTDSTAVTLIPAGGIVTPPGRTMTIAAETRLLTVPADASTRVIVIPPDNRTLEA